MPPDAERDDMNAPAPRQECRMKFNSKIIVALLCTAYICGATAQIDVHEEPLHHEVFANEFVRILEIVAHPNDTSLVHRHANNYSYIVLKGGRIWNDVMGSEARTVDLKSGFIGGYFENPAKPLVHRFANKSDEDILLVAVEHLSANRKPPIEPSTLHEFEELVIDNPYFLVTKVPIQPNARLDLQPKPGCIIINMNQQPIKVLDKEAPSLSKWIWAEPNKNIRLLNPLPEVAWIVLVQVKN